MLLISYLVAHCSYYTLQDKLTGGHRFANIVEEVDMWVLEGCTVLSDRGCVSVSKWQG